MKSEIDLPQGFSLRVATSADQTVIRRLVTTARINPSGLDWRRFFVIQDPYGRVVACGQVKPHRDGSRELASLAVAAQLRNRGLGGALVTALQKHHGSPLYLMCRSNLTTYYERFGFQELTEEMEQPPYYKRVRRLFGTFTNWMTNGESTLAVMVWEGDFPPR